MLGNNTNMNRKRPFPPGEYHMKDLNFRVYNLTNISTVTSAGRYLLNISTCGLDMTNPFTIFQYILCFSIISDYILNVNWVMFDRKYHSHLHLT